MSRGWSYNSGDNNLICDICGKKIKASESRQRWDGFRVCIDDFEIRHPQDFVKAKVDKMVADVIRPQPQDTFITVTYISTENNTVPVGTFNGEL